MRITKLNTMAESKRKNQDIAPKLLDYPVQSNYTGHCTVQNTGQKVYTFLRSMLGEKLQDLYTETAIQIYKSFLAVKPMIWIWAKAHARAYSQLFHLTGAYPRKSAPCGDLQMLHLPPSPQHTNPGIPLLCFSV